jgi:protein-S-isoprenylcysteine O-methyltransferase Ste14
VSDVTRENSPSPNPLSLMLAGVLMGTVGLSLEFTQWRWPGLVVQTAGAVLAVAGMLLLVFGKD